VPLQSEVEVQRFAQAAPRMDGYERAEAKNHASLGEEGERTMTTSRSIRAPLWAILLTAVVAAMASYFVFAQSGEAAPAADGSPSPKIVGGKPVPDGKYPFMAALIDATKPKKAIQFCGGSLIDKTHVLTAGHCVLTAQGTGPPTPSITPRHMWVSVGRTVLSRNQGQLRNVKDIDVHPAYTGNPLTAYAGPPINQSHDVAVITLSRPVSGIKPIELATSSQNDLERPGRDATVAGWGNTIQWPAPCGRSPQPNFPNRMREAQVPIISDSRANKAYEEPRCGQQPPLQGPADPFVPPFMIAAGGTKVDTCQADSGGPLFVRTSSNTQIGITSFGFGCAANVPGAYTEVNAKPIASFIERTTASN
jgi:secreted trypsin-like serine protease